MSSHFHVGRLDLSYVARSSRNDCIRSQGKCLSIGLGVGNFSFRNEGFDTFVLELLELSLPKITVSRLKFSVLGNRNFPIHCRTDLLDLEEVFNAVELCRALGVRCQFTKPFPFLQAERDLVKRLDFWRVLVRRTV